MNKSLTATELSPAASPATKRQKLMRFAKIIRSGPAVRSISSSASNTATLASGNIFRILVRHSHSPRKIASCTPPAYGAAASVTRNVF